MCWFHDVCRSPAADALLVYIPHPAAPHMDRGAAWTPHMDLAVMLLLRCFLEARSNSMGKWRSRNAQHRPLPAKFLWRAHNMLCVAHACGFLVFFVVNSCLFALPCPVFLALPCWAQNVARAINARKPPAAPQSRSPRRSELSWRVRNVLVRVQARVRVVGLHGVWQPQKERKGVFFGD